MEQFIPKATLAAGALFCLLTAGASGLRPEQFSGRLGLSIANAGGANEIRAQYAGFFLALAVLCVSALMGSVNRQAALIALVVTFGGLLAGRLASLLVNRGFAGFPPGIVALYLVDFIGLSLALYALFVVRS